MSENSPAAESAAASVAAVVDNVVAATEGALEAANERAEAAEQVAALVAEAAVQRTITDDVDDLREELEACQSEVASLRASQATMQEQLAGIASQLTTLVTLEIMTAAIAEAKAAQPLPAQSTQQQQSNPTAGATVNPSSVNEEGHPAPPASPEKPSRYRLT